LALIHLNFKLQKALFYCIVCLFLGKLQTRKIKSNAINHECNTPIYKPSDNNMEHS